MILKGFEKQLSYNIEKSVNLRVVVAEVDMVDDVTVEVLLMLEEVLLPPLH